MTKKRLTGRGVTYETISITTDGSGNATAYSSEKNGRIVAIYYNPGTSQWATGIDVTITTDTTVQSVLTLANAGTTATWFYPKVLGSKNVDGASSATYHDMYAADELIKIVLAQGGATKTGSITIVTDNNQNR